MKSIFVLFLVALLAIPGSASFLREKSYYGIMSDGTQILRVAEDNIRKRFTETVGDTTFTGEVVSQSALESDATWRIKRTLALGILTVEEYADSGRFTQVWNDRTSLFPAPPAAANTFSVLFDGINDHIDMNNGTDLQITGAMSISLWTKFGVNQAKLLVSKGGGGNNRGYSISSDTGASTSTFSFAIAENSTTLISSGSSAELSINVWHHIVGVFNPSVAVQIYIDGSLASENTTSIPAAQVVAATNFIVGAQGDIDEFYSGNIDELAVWNRDLTAAEVTTLFGGGSPGDINSQVPSNLVSYWRMGDGDTFAVIQDNAGSNDGVMTDMVANDIVTDTP